MKPTRFTLALFCLALMAGTLVIGRPTWAEELPKIIRELDFNDCDPVKLQGVVMSVNRGNMTITVAEKEIRLMDIGPDDQRMKTVLLNLDGKPEKIESFKAGQLVQVEGFEHPDGFVAASIIQRINSIQETRKASKSALPQSKAKR
jgi:hypothetical protein